MRVWLKAGLCDCFINQKYLISTPLEKTSARFAPNYSNDKLGCLMAFRHAHTFNLLVVAETLFYRSGPISRSAIRADCQLLTLMISQRWLSSAWEAERFSRLIKKLNIQQICNIFLFLIVALLDHSIFHESLKQWLCSLFQLQIINTKLWSMWTASPTCELRHKKSLGGITSLLETSLWFELRNFGWLSAVLERPAAINDLKLWNLKK